MKVATGGRGGGQGTTSSSKGQGWTEGMERVGSPTRGTTKGAQAEKQGGSQGLYYRRRSSFAPVVSARTPDSPGSSPPPSCRYPRGRQHLRENGAKGGRGETGAET
jgi:hypothetical protein